MIRFYPIAPVPAPRQGRADRWKPSPHVLRYRAYRDEVALRRVTVPDAGAHLVFLIEVPRSCSRAERAARLYQPHRQRPDTDNLQKALIDAVYRDRDDSHVWDIRTSKVWSPVAGVLVADHAIDLRPESLVRLLAPVVPVGFGPQLRR